MSQVFDLFIVGGGFCSLLTSLVLFLSGRHQMPANRFLAVVLLVMAWFVFQHRVVPQGLPTGYLFALLAPAFAYFYFRGIWLQDARLRKNDWLHFIPAGIGLLELLSTSWMGATPAVHRLLSLVPGSDAAFPASRVGQVPVLSAMVFLPVQVLGYLMLQGWLCRPHLRGGAAHNPSGFRAQAAWLLVLALVQALIGSSLALAVFLPATSQPALTSLISTGLIAISIYLLVSPGILYGADFRSFPAKADGAAVLPGIPLPAVELSAAAQASQPAIVKAESTAEEVLVPEALPDKIADPQTPAVDMAAAEIVCERPLLASPEQIGFYAGQLKAYLITSEIYRQQGVSINDVAVALRIPARQLSYVINQHYHQRFNDLINSYRVDYIIDRLQKDDWRALTLEGLAAEAGFSSRSTFFTAFKKVTSLNPTQFLQQLSKMAG